ncbi:MAG: hypothetical protein AAF603_04255 [Pseudomonadota bacterium]
MTLTTMAKIRVIGMVFGTFLSLLGPSSANASCGAWGCKGQITRIYAQGNGAILIGTDQDKSQANCTSPNNVYFTVKSNQPARDTFLAMLISAQSQNRELHIRIVENTSDCEVMYIVMDQ